MKKCGSCGAILDPRNPTMIESSGIKCATCRQTEELVRINELNRQREDRARREQEKADIRRRNDEVVRQYEESEDNETAPENSSDGNSYTSQSYTSQPHFETPKNRSCLGCLFKLVILAVVGFLALAALGYFLDKGGNKKSEKIPAESNSENIKSDGDTPDTKFNTAATPDQEISSQKPGGSISPGKSSTSDTQTKPFFENQNFPLHVVVTNEVRLLNNEGKEIVIPKGSMLKIDSRSAKGTLTLTFEGKLFVGNESRLLGKVKIR